MEVVVAAIMAVRQMVMRASAANTTLLDDNRLLLLFLVVPLLNRPKVETKRNHATTKSAQQKMKHIEKVTASLSDPSRDWMCRPLNTYGGRNTPCGGCDGNFLLAQFIPTTRLYVPSTMVNEGWHPDDDVQHPTTIP